ncbi:MAG TPA: hypothetical protein VG268_03515 [Streptosporangiaceae bacterium]|nr:hypothetical protein [Streptosporangiaceae bacterium]
MAGVTAGDRHRVVALTLPNVVAFDLSVAAQVFGHREERDRYTFTVCAEHPGEVPSTTGFTINAPAALAALRAAAARGTRIASICIGALALAATGLCWTAGLRPRTGRRPITSGPGSPPSASTRTCSTSTRASS